MAKIGVEISIDVKKIDKSRLYVGKNGATYLNMTTFINLNEKDQYDNNGFITESLTKEEREQKIQLPILGNCKIFWSDTPQQQQPQQQYQPQQQPSQQQEPPAFISEDIPF